MFKHRLSKIGKLSLVAACMLLVGGSFVSCEDDYFYDDKEPSWLGASIYNFLEEGTPGCTYANFVELIDSLGEKETLAHTGSKTLFVADDAAFERFFEDNPWGVSSVSEMSKAQMKILLYGSMLDNAMLLEMLSSSGAEEGDRGRCMRRTTSLAVVDSIPLTNERPAYNKFWDALRGSEEESLRLAKDGTKPMIVYFLPEFLKNKDIKASDIEFLFKKKGVQTKTFQDGEATIFGSKLISSGISTEGFSDDTMTITCKNGYVYRLDNVLLPPSNMAEELRRHEDTKIFSHLLDRFCIPVYDAPLTAEFRSVHGVEDSVFRLRYFAKETFETYSELKQNQRPSSDELLTFDPGWNQIKNSLDADRDMAAMFVPCDEVLFTYFVEGAGKFLIDQFASDVVVTDYASLITALDLVPEKNIAPFVRNLMKPSFADTVLSKFDKITDDANDEMGIKGDDVEECVIANNGVIYILNNVFGPAEFQAVLAPAKVFDNMRIMNNIVSELKYHYYLLAMDANYSFIIPDDTAFVYYDPISKSANSPQPYVYTYHFGTDNNATPLVAEQHKFNKYTYEVGDSVGFIKNQAVSSEGLKPRMTDIIEYLIIVHDEGDGIKRPDGTWNPRQYYMTKGYGTIKVDTSDPELIKFYGGEQLENGTVIAANTDNIYAQKNGYTFCTTPLGEAAPSQRLSGIPTPPTRSVFENVEALALEEGEPFYEFFELCSPVDTATSAGVRTIVRSLFPKMEKIDNNSVIALNDTMRLYSIFYTEYAHKSGEEKITGKINSLVPFFNNYHYTVYVPTNEAINEMFEKGLPNWDDIMELASDTLTKGKAAAQMRLLNNFLRYHFQDNAVYVDKVPFSMLLPGGSYAYEADFSTAVVNNKTGRFYQLNVTSEQNGEYYDLVITDQRGNKAKVLRNGEEGKTWNIMSRDVEYKVKSNSTEPTGMEKSSFSVIHSIDKALLHEGLFGYDGRFCRYADAGEPVVMMDVDGNDYLVASYGNVVMPDKAGAERKMKLAYLMKPLNEGDEAYNSKHTRETYLLNADGEKYLITEEGLLVRIAGTDEDDNVLYEYVVEDGNMLKVDNNGNVIERLPVAENNN